MTAIIRRRTTIPRIENPVATAGTDNASDFDFFGTENKECNSKELTI